MVINVDVFFLLNLAVDYLLLWAAGTWCGERVRPWRTLGAAAIGAAYAVLALLPSLNWLLSLPLKLLIGLGLVLVAYGHEAWHRTWRLWLVLVLVSLAAGGLTVVLGPALLPPAGGEPGLWGQARLWLHATGLTPPLLVALVLLTALGGRYVLQALTMRLQKQRQSVVAEVVLGQRRARLQTLVDTGHHLRDPFSGDPVLIAGAPALTGLLPPEVARLYGRGRAVDAQEAVLGLRHSVWAGRLRLVPYRAIGRPPGLLLGIRADRVTFWQAGRRVGERSPLTLAVTDTAVDGQGAFEALGPPELVNGGSRA